jgi:hypothetical protein
MTTPTMPRLCPHCSRSFAACYADPKGCGTGKAGAVPATVKRGGVEVCTGCNYAKESCGCGKK